MSTKSRLVLHVYRDLKNRQVSEPDDGPMAWAAHQARFRVLNEVLADSAYDVKDWDVADDKNRPHEFAEIIVDILQEPTAQAFMLGAAAYAGRIIAAQIDDLVGEGVKKIFNALLSAFKDNEIGDFWITLPDGSKIQLDPNANITISLRDGNLVEFHMDSPPE